MDRELSPERRRARRIKQGGWAMAALAVPVLIWWVVPEVLKPSLRRTRIRTAVVERGRIEATLQASGTVIPAFERVLSSPDEARVVRLLRRPGDPVSAGDEILELDTSTTRLDLARIVERLAQKDNEREQLRLELAAQLADLASQVESQQLDRELLSYRLTQHRDLFADGLTSETALRQVEVEARKAEVQLRQLQESADNATRTAETRLQRLELDIGILEQERNEATHRLELASARADLDGVLTWTVPEEGVLVNRGDVLARIADLSSFRVEATLSDAYASRLVAGQPVRVKSDEVFLDGTISAVRPTIDNGAATFEVALDDPAHPSLRQNRRVDVLVITEVRDDTLIVRKGPYARTGTQQQVFVIRGDLAFRTDARFGVSGFDEYEILDGLELGDEIIISAMNEHLHLTEIKIK